ncbi:MAG: amphi-Trp domain-containing protein [Gammaproteobacteria bacterium]|nr:amphi-Trp domain-containing protein [Gammaproteobacteria bacterium]
MKAKNIFKHESLQDRKTIIRYLKAINDGIAKGALSFADDSNEITLTPQGVIRLKVNVLRQDNTRELQILFNWKESDNEKVEDPGTLVISAD